MAWKNESRRHALASKGVKTAVNSKPVAVDLRRYQGKWFDVGHYPQSFQRDCVTSIAEYKKTKSGIDVKNTCVKKDGAKSSISGSANIIPPDTLGVSFFPFFSSPYKVEWVDKNYERAIVGHPEKKNLWFLSRKQSLSNKKLERMKKIAKNKGYSPSKLTKVKQK